MRRAVGSPPAHPAQPIGPFLVNRGLPLAHFKGLSIGFLNIPQQKGIQPPHHFFLYEGAPALVSDARRAGLTYSVYAFDSRHHPVGFRNQSLLHLCQYLQESRVQVAVEGKKG